MLSNVHSSLVECTLRDILDIGCGCGERLCRPAGEMVPFVRILEPLSLLGLAISSQDPLSALDIIPLLSPLERDGMKTGGCSESVPLPSECPR